MINVSLIQALQIVQEKNAPLIDVQMEEDYEKEHLMGSVNIPIEKINFIIEKIVPDKTQALVIYCQKGIRSRAACDILLRMGYQNIYHIVKGLNQK